MSYTRWVSLYAIPTPGWSGSSGGSARACHWNIRRSHTRVSCVMLTAIVSSPLAGTFTGLMGAAPPAVLDGS
jgi:hypothetical protein